MANKTVKHQRCKRNKKRHNKTRQMMMYGSKRTYHEPGILNKNKSYMVKVFLEVLNMVKLYHWKTHSFAQHKATDDLYSKLNDHMDRFVEVLLGKDASRIKMLEKKIVLYDFSNITDFKQRIFEFRSFLKDLNNDLDSSRDSDLLNIRDEILGDINQFLYLLTFDK